MNLVSTLIAGTVALWLLLTTLHYRWITTLRAPCVWTMAAITGIVLEALVETFTAEPAAKWLQVTRFSAAALTLCPTMAILGAKRPQHAAWQWVVVALLAVLLLQPLQWWLLSGGSHFNLFTAWKLLIVAIIGLGIFNYLPTRNAVPSCLAAAGQLLAVWPWLTDTPAWKHGIAASGCCFAAAIVLAAWAARRASPGPLPRTEVPIEIQWREFRDVWGAFWALRVLQRVNQVAASEASPVRLTWQGFVGPDPAVAIAPPTVVVRTFEALLSRFL